MPTSPPESRPILVTGAAGFIGHHVCARLLAAGRPVLGVDNLDPYYDPQLKRDRVAQLVGAGPFGFQELDLAEVDATRALFEAHRPRQVIHLAAAVGVRASLEHPDAYVRANVTALTQVLEGCRRVGVEHLLFASSSSVYGLNEAVPFSEAHPVDHPISLYAATKRAGELMAHTWAHLHGLPVTGLRFFTVYGPWGRPDMALFHFTRRILAGEPIPVFNRGDMRRDFTYVGDLAESVVRLLEHPPAPGGGKERPDQSPAPFRLLNVGNNAPVALMDFIRTIEAATGREARLELLPMQPGDVHETYADSSALAELVDFAPGTPLEEGVRAFVAWYREYYGV
ncbi:MAG: NAD-dependent epimerase/dehydratase family protein [Alphaproteobacteria bacterium]|nr:NAD-dependent epimerase/dehydratase family protein [Alphaproteobacteria bacterium]